MHVPCTYLNSQSITILRAQPQYVFAPTNWRENVSFSLDTYWETTKFSFLIHIPSLPSNDMLFFVNNANFKQIQRWIWNNRTGFENARHSNDCSVVVLLVQCLNETEAKGTFDNNLLTCTDYIHIFQYFEDFPSSSSFGIFNLPPFQEPSLNFCQTCF